MENSFYQYKTIVKRIVRTRTIQMKARKPMTACQIHDIGLTNSVAILLENFVEMNETAELCIPSNLQEMRTKDPV